MSGKFIVKGLKRNGYPHRNDVLNSTVQSSIFFPDASNSNPVLSDREFPSLNESFEETESNWPENKSFKYSDKLKSCPKTEKNLTSQSFHTSNYISIPKTYDQVHERTHTTKVQNFCHPNNKERNLNKKQFKNINQDNSTSVKHFGQSSKEPSLSNQKVRYNNQKEFYGKHEQSFKTQARSSSDVNLPCESDNKAFCNKSATQKQELKDKTDGMLNNGKEKKKKRKSKVKRQIALQTGKVSVLTPEAHMKIVGKTSGLASPTLKSILTDINDEEEYPELGKPLLHTTNSSLKKDVYPVHTKGAIDKVPDANSEVKCDVTQDTKESYTKGVLETSARLERPTLEKKRKSEKIAVHPKDPITISFLEVLLNKNNKPKARALKEEIDDVSHTPLTKVVNNAGVPKIKMKKDVCQPHNLLDSSSPMVKRGKERENPKPKRPSQLKKIILLDRKKRKEQMLHIKNNKAENETLDNEMKNYDENELNNEAIGNQISSNESEKLDEETDLQFLSDNSPSLASSPLRETINDEEKTFSPFSENEDSVQDELILKVEKFNFSPKQDSSMVDNNLTTSNDEELKEKIVSDNLSLDKANKEGKNANIENQVAMKFVSSQMPINVVHSSDSFLSSLSNNEKKLDILNKEKAAKILLHTRNFREYCDHLISKDIDDAVFALIDDLARFQDRLHQKDPVKAHARKRMIYGIKEVKKYIKLKKLKCIIIAVDIENVETQGGLNDALHDIKVSAADHHIPYIFALSRKVLGKVCRKPVPMSCIGIFNYEGSECNFKKMIELQSQSKQDYNEIFSKLTSTLTDEETETLLKAKAEALETLCDIRMDILNAFFVKYKTDSTENTKAD